MLDQGSGQAVINGQLISQIPQFSVTPTGYAPWSAIGPGSPPSLPPSISGQGSGMPSNGGEPSTYGSANMNPANVSQAMTSPMGTGSPVIWAIAFLGVGMFLLHWIHFREITG